MINEKNIIFYDAECGFCDAMMLFIAKRDKEDKIIFISLQSALANKILRPYHIHPAESDTLIYLSDEHVFTRSTAVLEIFKNIRGFGLLSTFALYAFPEGFRDFFYKAFSKIRRRIWRKNTCNIPDPNIKNKFIYQ